MATLVEQKKQLRQEMLVKRTQLDQQEKAELDRWICNSLWELISERGYHNVHCYLPMGTEVDITPLIEKMLKENLEVVTPKTLSKRKLEHLVLTSLDELEEGVFGTRYPANAQEFKGKYDLILVPGLAFNSSNHRLGYGGGYYDAFLLQHPKAHKLGICYPFQVVQELPMEAHDVVLDDVLVAGR